MLLQECINNPTTLIVRYTIRVNCQVCQGNVPFCGWEATLELALFVRSFVHHPSLKAS